VFSVSLWWKRCSKHTPQRRREHRDCTGKKLRSHPLSRRVWIL